MKGQQGFSLIELIIVIVILGLLALTAIPRFLNITDEAENASVEGIAGGFATAVSFVRSQWEVDGRKQNEVILDGYKVVVDPRFGYPTDESPTGNITDVTQMTHESCQRVLNRILQNAPRNVLFNEDAKQQKYTVRVLNKQGGSAIGLDGTEISNIDLCIYHQVASLTLNSSTGKPEGELDLTMGKGMTYNPGTGQVLSFIN